MSNRNRNHRPFSVTLVCGLIFFDVIIQLAYLGDAYRSEAIMEPFSVICMLLLCVLATFCGVFMLLGANWSRFLFIAACVPLYVIYGVSMDGPAALVRGIVPVIFCVVLLSNWANFFFTGKDRLFPIPEQNPYVRQPRRDLRGEY